MLPLGWAGGYPTFAILALLLGLSSGGALTLCYTIGGLMVPGTQRTTAFGFFSAAALFGGSISPTVAGLIVHWDLRGIYYLDAALFAVVAVALLRDPAGGAGAGSARVRRLAVLFLIGLGLPVLADAAAPTPTPFPHHVLRNTELRALPRSANGRDYLLYVALPASYDSSPQKRYPVLYLCDGYWDFTLVTGFYGNLAWGQDRARVHHRRHRIPGRPSRLRRAAPLRLHARARAGRPAGQKSGHAAQFLSVVEKEIVPFVEKEYRADASYRVLGRQSRWAGCSRSTRCTRGRASSAR